MTVGRTTLFLDDAAALKPSTVWDIVGSVESQCSHPIAKALVSVAKQQEYSPVPVSGMHDEGGKGLRCTVHGSSAVCIGSQQWMVDNKVAMSEQVSELQAIPHVRLLLAQSSPDRLSTCTFPGLRSRAYFQ